MNRVTAFIALALAAFALSGCVADRGPSTSPAATPGAGASRAATAPPSSAATPTAEQQSARLSEGAKRYATSIGGKSRRGKTLYFIIGASTTSEAAAQAALDTAKPSFGDLQSYFIVQKSDNFAGMRPGWWIVVEPYREKKHVAEQLVFAQRGFPDAYVSRAKVKTTDPIPVYEDAVGL